ncbi:Maltodextrin phosphorylase,glycogen phosphorylase,glycogen/starch/alpha-glucan phosphorylases,Carbohydrate phosphorylase [Chlamydia poikilotherma]|uniref:Alpha-1,4 glucan phosphorylase n=1 Tax=Chlamydia poikilotherma TaxID=1967783 RepID=A0A3B0PS13_9CHLA|nr:glycogen/starch/alpha-glucan phosphorylase [Chlamydia poikilotherma]SYX08958.1 Maltodextrin phosphorylase,glycogen phosphorylase,glycogen/starch/alpha-glucan phosphorylases,Carbohydrate phosphorylase [Chlamydia poikilotherma]
MSFDKNLVNIETMKQAILNRLYFGVVQSPESASTRDIFTAVSKTVMEWLAKGWLKTQNSYYEQDVKRVYYISMEFLLGRSLKSNLLNLGILDLVRDALAELNYDFDSLLQMEADAGLGNGGLGRLAACYLDSMATLGIPAYGYGIRYDYGIFDQKIVNGYQVEAPDEWLRYGSPWEICRGEYLYPIRFYGRVIHYTDARGKEVADLVDTQEVLAMAYDVPIPGYGIDTVNTLRLWQAQSPHGFEFNYFNHGNYIRAIEDIALVENISRVLYPNDSISEGQELRLKQEYFLVSATIQDILRRYTKMHISLDNLPDRVAVQLNDTHPALGIAEMMHILIDREELAWDKAWDMTTRIFNYTNHTILPEALERWSIDLFSRLLPRHLEIIYEINSRWLEQVSQRFPGNNDKRRALSIIEEGSDKHVNMASLAIVGSARVNGVSAFHSQLIKTTLFKDFVEFFPDKFINVTNGITPRRWLALCNPRLNTLLDQTIGDAHLIDLSQIHKVIPFANDVSFREQWHQIKLKNKQDFALKLKKEIGEKIDPESLFDFHVKRIHEYKRQLMNILRVIYLYNDLKENSVSKIVPTTVIFAGKAAPGYVFAKLIIKLINSVADCVNNDPQVNEVLKVLFLPNYRVTMSEMIMPASDISEQISTAGMEASGTGNMKFALNGALTIGTMDGANIEMSEYIGRDNMFIFGLLEEEIAKMRREYYPQGICNDNPKIAHVLKLLDQGFFNTSDKDLFKPIVHRLLHEGDPFFVLADLESYIRVHESAANLFTQTDEWVKKSIYNVGGMGFFSSDRAIADYAKDIWNVPTNYNF